MILVVICMCVPFIRCHRIVSRTCTSIVLQVLLFKAKPNNRVFLNTTLDLRCQGFMCFPIASFLRFEYIWKSRVADTTTWNIPVKPVTAWVNMNKQ